MNLDNIFFILLYCLVLTIIIEGLVAFILGLRKKDLLITVLTNIATNPLLNAISILLLVYIGYRSYRIGVIVMEILVVFAEGLIYKFSLDYKKINPFILSLILNVVSYVSGLILNNFLF